MIRRLLGFALPFVAITAWGAEVEAVSADFTRVISPEASVQKLATGFRFVEGPVWILGKPGHLVFSDISADELLRWSAADGVSTYRKPSGQANGNTRDGEGVIVSCDQKGHRVVREGTNGTVTVLVDSFQGRPFNSPNDVVVKSDGTVWFTDPDYGRKRGAGESGQPGNFVYRFDPKRGETMAVAWDFDRPNGLCFSPDEKRLYVSDTGAPRHIRVFDVADATQVPRAVMYGIVGSGTNGAFECRAIDSGYADFLSHGSVFCALTNGVPDGIRSDADGRLWTSAGDGVHVYSQEGELLGRILVPESPSNLCFGGDDGLTLFMTARTSLYAVRVKVRGAGRAR